jgi:hypothetical protein
MKYFLIIIFLTCSTILPSQTLSYSRVILIESTPQTVPVGHVWKVESAVSQVPAQVNTAGWSGVATPTAHFQMVINGNALNISKVESSAMAPFTTSQISFSISGIDHFSFPMWLPAGTSLAAGTNIRYLSVIEFRENP